MRKCDWCNDWYNQQDNEKYCWACLIKGKDKAETVTLVWVEESTGNKKVVRVRKDPEKANEDVTAFKEDYGHVWTETKILY